MDIVSGCNIRPRIEVQQGHPQGILRAPLVTGLWDLWDYNRVPLTPMSYSTFQAIHHLRASLWHWFLTQWEPAHQKRWVSTCLTPEIQYQVSMERLESRVSIIRMSSNIYDTWNQTKKLQWSQNDPVCLPFLSTQVSSFPSKCRLCYSIFLIRISGPSFPQVTNAVSWGRISTLGNVKFRACRMQAMLTFRGPTVRCSDSDNFQGPLVLWLYSGCLSAGSFPVFSL